MLKSFLVSLVSFAVLDGIWLGFIMKDYNMRQLSEIGRIVDGKFDIQYFPAVLAYLLMATAITAFVMPALKEQTSIMNWFLTGALMGLLVYGIYDMTNLATLKSYPWAFALADIAWGTFIFGVVTIITKKATA